MTPTMTMMMMTTTTMRRRKTNFDMCGLLRDLLMLHYIVAGSCTVPILDQRTLNVFALQSETR